MNTSAMFEIVKTNDVDRYSSINVVNSVNSNVMFTLNGDGVYEIPVAVIVTPEQLSQLNNVKDSNHFRISFEDNDKETIEFERNFNEVIIKAKYLHNIKEIKITNREFKVLIVNANIFAGTMVF